MRHTPNANGATTSKQPGHAPEGVVESDGTGGMIEIQHVAGSTRSAYDEIFSGPGMQQPDLVWAMILDLMDVVPGMTLLDVACGEGQLVRAARERGLRACGVDLSSVAARRSAARGAPVGVANGEDLPYADGAFDLVVNFGSLEHYADPGAGAREMWRVLRPGGRALFQLPNTFGLRWSVLHAWRTGEVADDGQPIQRYGTRGQWLRLLEAAGFEVEDVLPYEDLRLVPPGPRGWMSVVRHPTRILVPLAPRLPVDMASMQLFLCRASRGGILDPG